MNERTLVACWHDGSRVGQFFEDPHNNVAFEYQSDYRGQPVSMSLPLQPDKHAPGAAASFLDNLLPTSHSARQQLALAQSIEAASDFNLAGAIGLECPGRLVLYRPESNLNIQTRHHIELRTETFDQWLQDRHQQPLMPIAGRKVAFTLAGLSPKAVLNFHGRHHSDPAWIPYLATSSTHILKAAGINDQPDKVCEEWFCMQIAGKLLGAQQVAGTDLWRECLKVERFDRESSKFSEVRRVHQEDFAQALGISSADSGIDQDDVDPASSSLLARAAQLVDRLGQQGSMAVPMLQKKRFFQQLMTRLLFGDPALGLKKFSIIHHENGKTELAPLYGLRCGLSTDAVDSENISSREMIVGQDRLSDRFTEQACIECAVLQLGISRRYAATELNRLRQKLLALPGSLWFMRMAEQYPEHEPVMSRVLDQLRERLE